MLRMKASLCSAAMFASPAMSGDQSSAVEIDDRSRREADSHEGQDLPRDILAYTDAADRQCRRGLCEHVATSVFRHRGADRRIDDARRDRIDADRRKLERMAFCKRLQRAID